MNLQIGANRQIRRPWSWTIGPVLVLFIALAASGKMLVASDAGSPKVADSGRKTLLDQFRAGPMAGVSEIVFAARKQNQTDGHWYANIGYYAHDPAQSLARGNQALQVEPGDRQAGHAGGRSQGWGPRPPGQLRWQDDPLQLSQGGNRGVPPVRNQRRRLGHAPAH